MVCDCLFLIERNPTTIQNIMLLKVRISIPPPSTTNTKNRMLPNSKGAGAMDRWVPLVVVAEAAVVESPIVSAIMVMFVWSVVIGNCAIML